MFESIDLKQHEWQSLQPLNPESEKRLWKKLRLEWNYHSNHIEGNTLTYGETELLLIHDQASGDHALRNYVEMKAHDLAIEHIRKLVKDERELGEADVRDLNRILLKEPFTKDAITPDGHLTKIEVIPGEYKKQPNNVRTADGDVFEFATPTDVPVKMADLIDWLRKSSGAKPSTYHPIQIAAKLHHDFSLIHPFGDGNGRTARLLVNYVLMRRGYVPLIVPTEQKESYLAALRKADAGDLKPLTIYLATCEETALDRGIRAGKGETLEETGDLEKEIEVFKRLQGNEMRSVEPKSPEALRNLYHSTLRPIFGEFVKALRPLDELFREVEIQPVGVPIKLGQSWDQAFSEAMGSPNAGLSGLTLQYHLRGFKGPAPAPFNSSSKVHVDFQEFQYSVGIPGALAASHPYTIQIPESQRREMIRQGLQNLFTRIKDQAAHKE